MATKNRQPHRKTSIYLTDEMLQILEQRGCERSDRSAFIRRAVQTYWEILNTTNGNSLKRIASDARVIESRNGWEGME